MIVISFVVVFALDRRCHCRNVNLRLAPTKTSRGAHLGMHLRRVYDIVSLLPLEELDTLRRDWVKGGTAGVMKEIFLGNMLRVRQHPDIGGPCKFYSSGSWTKYDIAVSRQR